MTAIFIRIFTVYITVAGVWMTMGIVGSTVEDDIEEVIVEEGGGKKQWRVRNRWNWI